MTAAEIDIRSVDFHAAVETTLRAIITELDYDLHKAIERNEEDGSDDYPALAEDFVTRLTVELGE